MNEPKHWRALYLATDGKIADDFLDRERKFIKQEKLEIIEHLEDQFKDAVIIDRGTFDLCLKHLRDHA